MYSIYVTNTMTGIDFVDTIVVRRSMEKGTKIVTEPTKKLSWAGQEFKKMQKEKQKLIGNMRLVGSKGTKMIHLNQMYETQIPSTKGLCLSTGKGTGFTTG